MKRLPNTIRLFLSKTFFVKFFSLDNNNINTIFFYHINTKKKINILIIKNKTIIFIKIYLFFILYKNFIYKKIFIRRNFLL